MHFKHIHLWLAALCALSPTLVYAQAASPPLADPLDAKAKVPAIVYQSPLRDYAKPGAPPISSWREANDNVNRIGGWRAYTREASRALSAEAAPAVVPAVVPPVAPAGSTPQPEAKPKASPMPGAGHGAHGAHGAHGGHGNEPKK